MKFLVVLVAIMIAVVWKQDLDRIDDSWFFRLRGIIGRLRGGNEGSAGAGWFVVFTVTYAVPLSTLAVLLWVSDGLLFGLVAIAIHAFVLLMAFDRIHPGALAVLFRQHWDEGDYQACYHYLARELGCTELPSADDAEALHATFKKLYVYRCFERMFVTLFWYLIAGPLGVLFAYISYQLRYDVLARSESPEVEPVESIIRLLEWLPLRLLGLTLGLVGNFENCFNRFKRVGFTGEVPADQAVYEYALCALDQPQQGHDQLPHAPPPGEAAASDYQVRVEGEIESLQRLMQRSQFTWLTVFALVTVLGW
ncbi:MAG: regulatory signaling modulator protein AmpE [Gammaproteobacteria bacterium]|nr:regulatory signaling modulator protein AmpE [Gammaproteobacteria bacterium]